MHIRGNIQTQVYGKQDQDFLHQTHQYFLGGVNTCQNVAFLLLPIAVEILIIGVPLRVRQRRK